MLSIQISVKKLPNLKELPLPFYATEHSAGMDLVAAIDEDIILESLERKLIPTGIAIALPDGFEAQVRPRSGLALKNGISCANAVGTIDADYRGEVGVILINLSKETFTVKRGMKIAQMIITEYSKATFQEVDELSESVRGTGGFGSTGIKAVAN